MGIYKKKNQNTYKFQITIFQFIVQRPTKKEPEYNFYDKYLKVKKKKYYC